MQCQAILKSGKQCSRKALLNSNFCWQHQNYASSIVKSEKVEIKSEKVENKNSNLLLSALQRGIVSNIIQLSGHLQPISNTLSNDLNKYAILGTWFTEIGVQTPISEINDHEIPLLWNIYQKRIDNYPNPELIDKAIDKGLRQLIFYSREHQYKDIIAGGIPDYEIVVNNVLTNKVLAKLYPKNNRIRKGDTIRLMQQGNYRNDGVFVYNGEKFLDLSDQIDEYGNLPKDIHINDYPIMEYFKYTIHHNNIVPFDTTDQKIVSKVEYKIETPDHLPIYLYKTDKNYYIWSFNNNLEDSWNKTLYFDTEKEVIAEAYVDADNENFLSILAEYDTIMSKLKSYKVLYDLNYYEDFD
jgi:hypothetical protein